MESHFFILPISIVKLIIESICDTETYRNLRLTSKAFKCLMPSVKSFYLNGILKSSIKFFKGVPIGSYNFYSEDGFLTKNIPVSEYGIDGVVRYLENFRCYYRCNFIENRKNGLEVTFFSNGKPYIESAYRCNLKNGREIIYYKNGLIYAKKNYKNGLLHGETNFYTNNGNLKFTMQFHNNMLNGEVISYFENSSPFIVCNFKNNIIYGEYKVYFINGNLKTSYNIKNGVIDGIVKSYHNNGTLRDLVKFKNGCAHGVHKSWYNNGNECIIEKYKNGLLHGDKLFFDYESGIKRNIYNFKYVNGRLMKYIQIKFGGGSTTLSLIYNSNNEVIGGKYSIFTKHIDIETDFNGEMRVNNYIHKLDMRNNIYYKYLMFKNTGNFIIKKFSDKNFLFSITKLNNEYKVFDNTVTNQPRKYYTDDLSEVFV